MILAGLLVSTLIYAQEFEVPENYVLKKAEDYAKYESDIIKCVDWLMATPLNEQKNKRQDAGAFLVAWLTGSPNVSIEIKQEIVTFIGSPDLLLIFMGGWTKYALESKDFEDMVAGTTAGIEAVMDFYTRNKAYLEKNKEVEKYIKMKTKGTLKDYIEKNA